MKWRQAILAVLALLTVSYRGMAVYTRYFSPDMSTRATYTARYEDGAMVVTNTDDTCDPSTSGPAQCATHLHPGDKILEIYDSDGEGGPVEGLFDYGALLLPIGAHAPWSLAVDRLVGEGRYVRTELTMPPAVPIERSLKELLFGIGFDFYLPLLAMTAGLFIGLMKPNDRKAFLAALVFLGFSVSFNHDVSQFPPVWREMALLLRITAVSFSPYLALRFFLNFPRPSFLARRLPWLSPAFLGLAIIIFTVDATFQFALFTSFDRFESLTAAAGSAGVTAAVRAWTFRIYAALAIVLSLAALAANTFRAEALADRRRMDVILTGAVVGLVPFLAMLLAGNLVLRLPFWILLLSIPLIGLFPICFVYAIVRYRVFGIRLILRRGLKYALVSRGFLIAEGIVLFVTLYFAVGPLLIRLVPGSGASVTSISIAAVTLGLVAGTRRVNQVVLPKIDRKFFRDAYNTQRILTELSKAVRQLASRPDQLISKVTDEISASLHPDQLAIFLADKPWPNLAPVDRDNPVCWEAEEGSRIRERFLLYVHRDVTLGGKRGRISTMPEGSVLASRVPLSHLLNASLDHARDTLDVFPAPSRKNGRSEQSAGEADCCPDSELFDRFNTQLIVPLATAGKVLGFMAFGEKLSEEPYSNEDKELLLSVAEQVAIALDYSQLIGVVAEQKKLEREIQIAQDVQARLFPQDHHPLSTLEYTGTCTSARGVGGDYYDFLHLGQDRFGITVADIAGKGLSAALLMASLQALVRSHAPTSADNLGDLAREINLHLCESTDDARFATFFFGVYESASRKLRYLNAGHNPPIVVRANGDVERLEAGGMVLGLFEEKQHTEGSISLSPGDLLVVYSDGLTEAMNEHGEEFGDRRLVDEIGKSKELSPEAIQKHLLNEVNRFTGPVPPHDDMTLIVARVT